MKEVVTPFKVGLLVIVGLGAAVFMFGRVREGIEDDASGYRVYATFNDVSGLVEKSRVVIAGITVGQIDRIELVGDQARVWLLVNTPLRRDATVAKRQASLLGEYYLQLTPGALGEPLDDGDEIEKVLYDVAPADLMNDAKEIVENVREITASVRTVVSGSEGEQRLAEILQNVNQTVDAINRVVAVNAPKLDGVVDNVVAVTAEAHEFSRRFRVVARDILADAQAITGDIRGIVGKSGGEMQEGFEGVKGAVTRLQKVLDQLEGTLGNAESITTKIDEGQGTIGRLINDDHLVDSITDLVDESGRFIKQITRLQTIIGMRSELYTGDSEVKNYFDLRLQPRPDKYYLFQLVDDPLGRVDESTRITRTVDGVIREDTTKIEDRFRITLQFAKRYYFATGRVGIMEDTGGLGLDLHFLEDRLELNTDIYDFDRDANPRMRLRSSLAFLEHVYIAVGVDEILNRDDTQLFFGGGIRFNDEDLKALLTAAPTPAF